MRPITEFIRTTLVGGVLVILPLYLAILLLLKAVAGLLGLVSPVAGALPLEMEFKQAVSVLLLVALCFLVGLMIRTGPGLRAKNAFEQAMLARLPGYTFLRGLMRRLTGQSDDSDLEPALIELERGLVPALIVERLDGGLCTVLVPSAPTPMAGSIYILPAERVHPVDIPFTTAIGVFSKWGTGAGAFLTGMKATPASARLLPGLARAGSDAA